MDGLTIVQLKKCMKMQVYVDILNKDIFCIKVWILSKQNL